MNLFTPTDSRPFDFTGIGGAGTTCVSFDCLLQR